MLDEIPARVIRLFGNDKARPKVVRVYKASAGWAPTSDALTLTWSTVDELLRQGVTSVEVSWHLRTRQFSILDMKRSGPDNGLEPTEPGAGQARRGRGIPN